MTVVLHVVLLRRWWIAICCGCVLEFAHWLELTIQTLVHVFLPFFEEIWLQNFDNYVNYLRTTQLDPHSRVKLLSGGSTMK